MDSPTTESVSRLFKQYSFLIGERKALLSPIQTMPTELIVEIISNALNTGIKKKLIASVSKEWKNVLLNTPIFWRRIRIGLSSPVEYTLAHLRRTLELSGTVTLDVELYLTSFDRGTRPELIEQLRTLADAGAHRWRSLWLVGYPISHDQPNPICGIFTGKTSSLRSLTISSGYRSLTMSSSYQTSGLQDIFDPIYSLIAETKPCLHNFTCVGREAPEALTSPSIYRNLKSISAGPATIARLRPKFDVPNLQVHMDSQYPLKPFELPHTTTFDYITLGQLSECSFNNIQVLKVFFRYRASDTGSNVTILRFPKLHTLEIRADLDRGLPWLLDTEAPHLSRLTIINSWSRDSRATHDSIHRGFLNEPHRIKVAPTHLDLRVELMYSSTLRILKHWPQIQDLTLYWDQDYAWDGGELLKGLCNKNRNNETLCPDLSVLRIVMTIRWPQATVNGWLQAMRRIIRARKNILPLWKIILMDYWGGQVLHSVTALDV